MPRKARAFPRPYQTVDVDAVHTTTNLCPAYHAAGFAENCRIFLILRSSSEYTQPGDCKPSIGIILCKAKNQVVAEYARADLSKPVGVSTYITKLVESLPPALRGSLPSPKELEAELRKDDAHED